MRKIILYVLISLILFLIPAFASDIYMVKKSHTDGMQVMGQTKPAEDKTQKIWIGEDKIKSESEDKSVIMLLNDKKMIVLNHEDKTYAEIPMGMDNMMDKAMEGKSEEEKKEMQGFMQMAKGMMKFDISVTPTSETKKINNWDCKKYNQEMKMGMGPINSEVWATEDLDMDYEMYAKFSSAMMSMRPGLSDSFSKAIEELKKIKGVPVFTKTTMNMMGMQMNSTEELIEFKKEPAPKGTFDIPKGYKKTDAPFGQ